MELIVNEDWQFMKTNFYLKDGKTLFGMQDGEITEYNTGVEAMLVPIKPLLSMPRYMAENFLQAMSDYLSNKNIVTVNEYHLKGKVEATEKHLEDMREMAKQLLADKLKPDIVNVSESR